MNAIISRDDGGARQQANIPAYVVIVDGKDISAMVRPRLISLSLTEKRGGEADQLDLVLDDSKGDLAIPKEGAIITLSLGWAQGRDVAKGLVAKGRFKVDEAGHSGPPDIITISARSADLQGDFRVRKERSWRAQTLGAIIGQIAADNGLEPRIAADLAAIVVDVVDQDGKSDMALVRDLGKKYDAVATVKDRKLVFARVGAGVTSSGLAIPALTITRASGDRHDYRRAERDKYDGAEARWHDTGAAKRKTEKVGGRGTGASPKRLKRIYASQADAKAAAAAEAQRIARGAAELSLALALGNAGIYPERRVTVTGFKAEIDAHKWLISEVIHSVDASGYRTRIKLETSA
ncbi:contractile injection system protein, VgrG/Pvc8 family [Sphingobium yanoikuyae]|uniref:contractile injection system protein, VgrG/Pvc8 family n=1 Tax=Sphingobium yanoikuyae TaxID=13690 RepID=UPI000847683E|nr:contractile injection system protein, VgrG/Pvc8 family [Sphingobium yanoikuyae]